MMMNKLLPGLLLAVFLSVGAPVGAAVAGGHQDSWTGEVVGLSCYVQSGARGPDHAGCAKTCIKSGQPMGFLSDDGTLLLLASDHKHVSPFELLKDLAGERAEIAGTLAEKDGMKVLTVKAAKAAP